MNMKEAYLKVLGLQEEKSTVERAAWVPASIAEEHVQAFMEAVKSALSEKQEVVQFEGKKWKISEKKSCASEASMMDKDEDEEDDDEDEEDDETEIVTKKSSTKSEAVNPYAVGMATAMKTTGDEPPLEKSTIKKAHKIAKAIAKEEKYSELIATLSEGGLSEEEIEGIIAKLDEELKGDMHPDAHKVLKHIKPEHHGVYKPYLKKGVYKGDYKDRSAVLSAAQKAGHVKEDVNLEEASAPQEMGDNLSGGELDFIDTHEVEVIDGTPEKPDFDKDLDKAEEPKAQGAGKVEVDGKKAAEKQTVTTTPAAKPTTK